MPRAAQTIASAMPVLPLVGSTTTVSGPMRPASWAASIIATPIRSLTECAGLKNSSFAATSAPVPSVTFRIRPEARFHNGDPVRASDVKYSYERVLDWGKRVLGRTPVLGPPLYETLHGVKKGIKDVVAPQGMFEDLGLKYLGPVDGHDVASVESVLRAARRYGGPVIVHVITEKGRGYAPAENDEAAPQLVHFPGAVAGTLPPMVVVPAKRKLWLSVFGVAVKVLLPTVRLPNWRRLSK